ncbi:prokaryotic type I DNA topoisomerase [Artomyces pyxidatus]|uniref:Prokaryotic type I DNA topoisomerase n=1 Tax=Artomyces pyxidatus TaxID=48021 RepID=A0ACB8TAU4_9AGAM|nr:prokaryotic type I DNA topoisomerase [Artomyces pyxidatus]
MKVLCVAEKPSISKAITQILSGGQFQTRNTTTNFVKNYDFDYPQTRSSFTVTCVAGHLLASDFADSHRKWHTCDPFALFDAPIVTEVATDKKSIEKNLIQEARKAQQLMIWTDCDREGENIGAEIAKVCRKARPGIVVKRARFSAIIAQQIHNAAQHPVDLDMAQAAAVDARIILDLRIGAAFTRMQTVSLQNSVQDIQDVVSYGPCQFPTLGFVVSRYNQVKAFQPEKFWYIYLALTRNTSDGPEETSFTWRRGHLFEFHVAFVIYQGVLSDPRARVTKVTKKNTKKWKPLPLTTVDLQKAGSRLLKLAPKKILDIAEKLYQNGFLSYPRTETDQFDPQFDFMTLIGKQTVDPLWGPFATSLQDHDGFSSPRRGKNNDQAHPPIHPTAHAGNLVGDEKRVYEFVTRRFLACCSKDALGFETTVDVVYGGEEFYATGESTLPSTNGLIVLERNYLDVYPYDKWNGKEIPDFEEGEEFEPSICELREGTTTKPNLLTEADLVGLMDKNGIGALLYRRSLATSDRTTGTDATIAQHIETIVERKYVIARMDGSTKYLVPSTLGIGLIEGYDDIGFDRSLSKPQLRRETERSMVEVCQGTKTKNDMLVESIEQYKERYIKAKRDFVKVVSSVKRYVEAGGGAANANGGDGGRGRGGARGHGRGGRGGGRGGGGRGGGHDDGGSSDDGGGGRMARGRGRGRGSAPRGSTSKPRGGARNGPEGETTAPVRRRSVSSRSNPAARDNEELKDTREAKDSDEDLWDAVANTPPSLPPTRAIPAKPRSAAGPIAGPSENIDRANNGVKCHCGELTIERTVNKEGLNKGRRFRRCASSNDCKFFAWVDEPAYGDKSQAVPAKRTYSEHTALSGDRAIKRCRCDLTAVSKTVSKEGPTKGRLFWACPNSEQARCGFFEWDHENADPGSGMASTSRSHSMGNQNGQGSGECFTVSPRSARPMNCLFITIRQCGQPGHWASACPEKGRDSLKRAKTSMKASSSLDSACFKCGQNGHYSRDCSAPNMPKASSSTRRSSGSRGPKTGRGRGGRAASKSRGKGKSAFGAADDY